MTLNEIRFKQTLFTEASRATQHRAVKPAGSHFVSPTCVSHGTLHQLCHIWFTSGCSGYPPQDSSDEIKVSFHDCTVWAASCEKAQSVWKDFKVWFAEIESSLISIWFTEEQRAKGFSQPWTDHECTGNKLPGFTLLENSSTSVFHCLFRLCCLPANALLDKLKLMLKNCRKQTSRNEWINAQNSIPPLCTQKEM